mgnify:FL=1
MNVSSHLNMQNQRWPARRDAYRPVGKRNRTAFEIMEDV